MKPNDLPVTAPARHHPPSATWPQVYAAACAPYRAVPGFWRSVNAQWAYFWARGKLGHDPVFRGLLERGELRPGARVVDIGCGQGLVAALLHATEQVAGPGAPSAVAYTGIELMPKDTARAERALRELPFAPRFITADMRQAPLPPCDLVVILDVLHYVDHAAQDAVLRRVREALQPRGRLLLRVGDASATRGFAASQWVDRIVTAARGHGAAPTWGRPLEAWVQLLQGLGFRISNRVPQSQGTPFANVLLVADLEPAA